MKPIHCLFAALLVTSFFTFGFFGSSPESIVKDTKIAGLNKTLGELLEGYRYGLNPKWSVQKTDDGKEFVEFLAAYSGNGIIASLFSSKDGQLPLEFATYLDSLPPQIYIVGRFLLDGNKIANSIIQMTDNTGKIVVPMSLPLEIFAKNIPIDKTFITDQSENYYRYQSVKYLFSSTYGQGLTLYFPYQISGPGRLFYPFRLEGKRFEFDDQNQTIKIPCTVSLLNYPLSFNYNPCMVNNIPLPNRETTERLERNFNELAKFDPAMTEAKSFQTAQLVLARNYQTMNEFYPEEWKKDWPFRISYEIKSYSPFICEWRFHPLSSFLKELLSTEDQKAIENRKSLSSNILRNLAMNSSSFGKGTQIILFGNDNSRARESDIKYSLKIYYDESNPNKCPFDFIGEKNGKEVSHYNGECVRKSDNFKCQFKNSRQIFMIMNKEGVRVGENGAYLEYIKSFSHDIGIDQSSSGENGTNNLPNDNKSENTPLAFGYYYTKSIEIPYTSIFINGDGTGYALGTEYINFTWKATGDKLEVDFENGDGITAPIISGTAFSLEGTEFKLDKSYKQMEYDYKEDGYEGVATIGKSSVEADPFLLIETVDVTNGNTCSVYASCKDAAGSLMCHTTFGDAEGEIRITSTKDGNLALKSTYPRDLFCGDRGNFEGNYVKKPIR